MEMRKSVRCLCFLLASRNVACRPQYSSFNRRSHHPCSRHPLSMEGVARIIGLFCARWWEPRKEKLEPRRTARSAGHLPGRAASPRRHGAPLPQCSGHGLWPGGSLPLLKHHRGGHPWFCFCCSWFCKLHLVSLWHYRNCYFSAPCSAHSACLWSCHGPLCYLFKVKKGVLSKHGKEFRGSWIQSRGRCRIYGHFL